MLTTIAIIQRFSLHKITGGYNHSESGSPGALQEHGGGALECVERWREQESYLASTARSDTGQKIAATQEGVSIILQKEGAAETSCERPFL